MSAFEQALASDPEPAATRLHLVTDVLGDLDGKDWSSFVVDRISRYCPAYFDQGQALWAMPGRDASLHQGLARIHGL